MSPLVEETATWLSIGNGTTHAAAAQYTNKYFRGRFMGVDAFGEQGWPGGSLFTAAVNVAMELERDPIVGVSPVLQIGRVTRKEFQIGPVVREATDADVGNGADRLDLATSWKTFESRAAAMGLDASAATT